MIMMQVMIQQIIVVILTNGHSQSSTKIYKKLAGVKITQRW